jgi:hypothetical protein
MAAMHKYPDGTQAFAGIVVAVVIAVEIEMSV